MRALIFLLSLYLGAMGPAWAVEAKPLFKLPWGSEEAALGLIDLPEVERVGPRSFCLDGQGHLFICDGVNRCVKEFDAKGQLVAIVARDIEANHVIVDDQGTLFARCDRGRIAVFSGGKRIGGFQVGPEVPLIEGYEQGISLARDPARPDAPAWVLVNDPAQRHYQVAQGASKGNRFEAVTGAKSRTFLGRPMQDGVSYQPRWVNRHQGLLRCFPSEAAETRSIEITTEDALGGLIFKGVAPQGHLVMETGRITPDGYGHLEIRLYSPSGELLDDFELPNLYYTTVYRKTWLRPDGAIVQMLTEPDGVSFTVWK